MALTFTRASTAKELHQILALQQQNMAAGLSQEEALQEGFITVGHTFEILKKMNDACSHIITKDGDNVVGYALVMLRSFRDEIAVLRPMFDTADALLPNVNYVTMGQVCIAKSHRKQGIFKGMYTYYRQQLQAEFDSLFTEVATTNRRSLQAHKAVGFEVLQTQITDGVSWELINWDWTI
ncbi:GNAT family N-acetyltransferase [Maribacter sp.]|nr:GNAT family N-acetyltransferase [Maribacter sp.]